MKTVKVVSGHNNSTSRRVELFSHDLDGNEHPTILCKVGETPRARCGIASNWETTGDPDRGYQWWKAK